MITNATLYRITAEPADDFDALTAFNAAPFVPCGPTQQISSGWVPPRGIANGALLEIIDNQWILKLATETRKVPTDVLERLVSERCKNLEADTGRKPGKKERQEIKENALLELLPQAFPSRVETLVWIDVANKLVLINSASSSRADVVIHELINCQEGLQLEPLQATQEPALAMAQWLRDQSLPEFLEAGSACELKSSDEPRACVKYANHDLFIPEIQAHLAARMLPSSLALIWDDRVTFTLTDNLTLKKIEYLEDTRVAPEEEADAWDADVSLATGELRLLVPDLIRAIGGEVVLGADVTDVEPKVGASESL